MAHDCFRNTKKLENMHAAMRNGSLLGPEMLCTDTEPIIVTL
jgi:hypothetical protein